MSQEYPNPFVLQPDEYKRELDLTGDYLKQASNYLHIMTGKPIEQCEAYIRKQLRVGGRFKFDPPIARFTERQENGDRVIKEDTIFNYIRLAIANEDLIAPTFTTYINPNKKEALLVGYINGNVKRRSVAKKAMFKADREGDTVQYAIKKNEQNNRKLGNNAISGGHVSPFTPLYNKTAHSTLTSNCRSTSGYGNANNEKMLSGNRHYHEPDVVLNNIVSIITITDLVELDAMMKKYNVHYPTPEEVMSVITYSTDLYWKNRHAEMARIEELIHKLSPVQRAAFTYVGDFYHFTKYNDGLARKFIGSMIPRCSTDVPDPGKLIKLLPEDNVILARQIINNDLRGKKDEEIEGTQLQRELAGTALNITNTSMFYGDLIKALFVTKNVPASLAYFPDSIRRSALTSDTDSTIFTVQDWVKWYCGKYTFSDEGMGVAATMIWMSSQSIIHILARMSANFGIGKDNLFRIAMKNEFKFDVFVPTSVAKHYFALIGCQEGNLKDEYEKEIKGVHLKSSSAPRHIIQIAQEMMLDIMNTVLDEKRISILKYLKWAADVERQIFKEIKAGHYLYFRRSQIKDKEAYKGGPIKSNYFQYTLWNEVFGPKYGIVAEPPYDVVKVSLDCPNPTRLKEWLEAMPDQDIAKRFRECQLKYNKPMIRTIFIPREIVKQNGLPEEIHINIAARSMVLDMTKVFKIIMETLGFFVNPEALFSEHY